MKKQTSVRLDAADLARAQKHADDRTSASGIDVPISAVIQLAFKIGLDHLDRDAGLQPNSDA